MALDKSTNRFYLNRREIGRIGRENNVDVSVASSMLASEKKWTGYVNEMNDWMEEVRKYAMHKTLTIADLINE